MKGSLLKLKSELLQYMNEAIELFESSKCIVGYVYWFKEKTEIIKNTEINSKEFKKALRDIYNSFGGIGSFSDVVIIPKENSGLGEEDATEKQFELIEKIGNTIDKILKELRAEKRKSKKRK